MKLYILGALIFLIFSLSACTSIKIKTLDDLLNIKELKLNKTYRLVNKYPKRVHLIKKINDSTVFCKLNNNLRNSAKFEFVKHNSIIIKINDTLIKVESTMPQMGHSYYKKSRIWVRKSNSVLKMDSFHNSIYTKYLNGNIIYSMIETNKGSDKCDYNNSEEIINHYFGKVSYFNGLDSFCNLGNVKFTDRVKLNKDIFVIEYFLNALPWMISDPKIVIITNENKNCACWK